MSFSRLPQISIAINLSQLLSSYSQQYNLLFIGHINGTTAPVPQPGYSGPSVSLYEPFHLNPLTDPNAMMAYMAQLGFNVVFGVTETISLGVPNTATVNPDTSVTLTWTSRPSNFGLLPTSGNGTVTQATSAATGTYGGFGATGYSVVITGVTGVFDTTHDVTVTLSNPSATIIDATESDEIVCMVYNSLVESLAQNTNSGVPTPNIYIACLASTDTGFGTVGSDVFNFVLTQNTYYNAIVMPYEVTSSNDVEVTYARFFDSIIELNAPAACASGFFGTEGVWAVTSVDRNSQADLVTDDSPYFTGISYPYDNTSNIVPQLPAQVGAAAATVIFTNPPPFFPLNEIILNSLIPPVSANEGLTKPLSGETLAAGYTPIYINSSGLPAFVRTITSMLHYPDTTQPATEYFDVQPWQVLFLNRAAKYTQLLNYVGKKKASNKVLSQIRHDMIAIDKQFERLNMLENVDDFLSQYRVSIDPNDNTNVIVTTPVEVIPGLQNVAATIYLQNKFGTFSVSGFVTGG